jgi:hypothetical protein
MRAKQKIDINDDLLGIIRDKNSSFLSVCQESWSERTLICKCLTCQTQSGSCICLQCFFNGNHKEHEYYFISSTSGNCDCGDYAFGSFKCSNHKGTDQNPHLNQLDFETSELIQQFSSRLFSLLNELNVAEGCRVLSSLVSLGDGMRRCVVIGIQDKAVEYIKLMINSSPYFNKILSDFFGKLINDDLFRIVFSRGYLTKISPAIEYIIKSIQNHHSPDKLTPLSLISFHAFNHVSLRGLIKDQIDISSLFAEMFIQCYSIIVESGDSSNIHFSFLFSVENKLLPFLCFLFHDHLVSEEKKFFDILFKECVKFEGKSQRSPLILRMVSQQHHIFSWVIKWSSPELRNLLKIDMKSIFTSFSCFLRNEFHDTPMNTFSSISKSPVSYHLMLHCVLVFLLAKHSDRMLDVVNIISKINNFDPDHFLMYSLIFPLRFFLSLIFNQVGLYPLSNPELTTELQYFSLTYFFLDFPISIFYLIQIFVGLIQNKNQFLKYLFHFTELERCSDPNTIKSTRLLILIFIMRLYLDRSFFRQDDENYICDLITSILYSGPIQVNDFFHKYSCLTHDFRNFYSMLTKVAVTMHADDVYSFRLKNSSKLNIYCPFVSISNVFSFLGKHVSLKSKSLLPCSVVEQEPFCLKLFTLLTSKLTFSLLYAVLWSYHFDESTKSEESIFVVFDYLRLIASIEHFTLSSSKFQVQPFELFPFDSFAVSFQTPLKFGNSDPYSMLQLVEKIDHFGIQVLESMCIQYIYSPPNPMPQTRIKVAQTLRSSILSRMTELQNLYLPEEDESETFECIICSSHHEDDIFCYPLLVVDTNLSYFLDQIPLDKSVLAFSTCGHSFHTRCLANSAHFCPLCRSAFFQMLPILELYGQLSNPNVQVGFFLDMSSDFLFDSFCSSVSLFDFRQRHEPTSIQDQTFSKMLSALYSLLWYLSNSSPIQPGSFQESPFSYFVYDSLKSNDLFCDFERRVHQVGDSLDSSNLFVFLRRVIFFQHFVFNNAFPQANTVIDWDSELSFESLCSRFKFTFPGKIQISSFPLIPLPKNFIDFMHPPYQFPLAVQTAPRMICLLDGVFVRNSESDNCTYPLIHDHLKQHYSSCTFPVPFLILSGVDSTKILFVNQFRVRQLNNPIYLDYFGIPNCGFLRRSNLILSSERVESLIHFILTLKWIPKRQDNHI